MTTRKASLTRQQLWEKIRTFKYNEHQGIALSPDHLDYIMSEIDEYVAGVIGKTRKSDGTPADIDRELIELRLRNEQRRRAGIGSDG